MNKIDVEIRQARKDDAGAIAEHLRHCWREAYAERLGPAGIAKLLASLATEDIGGVLPGADELAVVATIDGEIVGTAVGAVRGETAHIWGMYVHPDHQRGGLGHALLQTLMAFLAEAKGAVVHVLNSSQGAVIFYEKIGFVSLDMTDVELVEGTPQSAHVMFAPRENLKFA